MRKLLAIVLALAPTLLFAGELKVSAVDKELEIPLEGVKISEDFTKRFGRERLTKQAWP